MEGNMAKASEVRELMHVTNCADTDGNIEALHTAIDTAVDECEATLEVDGMEFRIIADGHIGEVMRDEMMVDDYVLGCYCPWAIADVLNCPAEAVERVMSVGEHKALGMMVSSCIRKVELLRDIVVRFDGYGPHFATYDGEQLEVRLDGALFLVFRTN